MWEKTILFYWGFRTLGQPAKRAERSGVSPTNPLAFSLDLLYSEMSSISINELCFDPWFWYLNYDLLVKSCRKYIVGNRIGEKYMILYFGYLNYDPWFWYLNYDPLLWYFVVDLLVKSCRKYISVNGHQSCWDYWLKLHACDSNQYWPMQGFLEACLYL